MQAGKSGSLSQVPWPQEEEVVLSTWSTLVSAFCFGARPMERSADSCMWTSLHLHAVVKMTQRLENCVLFVDRSHDLSRREASSDKVTWSGALLHRSNPITSFFSAESNHYLKTYTSIFSVSHSPTGMEANSLSARAQKQYSFMHSSQQTQAWYI